MIHLTVRCRVSTNLYDVLPERCHPRMFLSGVQVRVRLDSRYKHAGMTV